MKRRTLVLKIDCINDAGAEPLEQARLLEVAAEQLREGYVVGYLRDVNGNNIGYWEYQDLES